MKLNTGKCCLLIYRHKYKQVWMEIGEDGIQEASNVELLRILTENPLKFDSYVSNICSKAKNKLSVLTRIIAYLDSQSKSII